MARATPRLFGAKVCLNITPCEAKVAVVCTKMHGLYYRVSERGLYRLRLFPGGAERGRNDPQLGGKAEPQRNKSVKKVTQAL